jgi:hypothetical protein
MKYSLALLGIVVGVGCGGRVNPDSDGGSGGAGGSGGSGGSVVGGTGGTTTIGGTGGTTVGGPGGTTGGGGTGGVTVGGAGGGSAAGGTGGATGGAGGVGGATGGSGGSGTVPPDYRTCTGPGQCELTPTQCCSCGLLGLNQLSAINIAKRPEFKQWSCGPAPVQCPPCVGTADPYLIARCQTNLCTGFDVRTDPTYTKCGSDQDCMLRQGLGCCECNPSGQWVAISKVGAMILTPQVCGPSTACPGCFPTPPAGYSAVCRAGACQLLTP